MALPHIVYKARENNSDDTDVLPVDNDQGPVLDDELLDAIAEVLADTRAELREEWQAAIDKAVTELRGEKDLHEAIAELRGQLAALTNLFGNGPKLFEAEQTVRKLKVSAGDGGT
jgi:FMN phosphatase YigB (HAD superfamily)